MPAVACEDAFMDALLSGLDSESLFLPPSSSQPRLNPTPTRRKRPAAISPPPTRIERAIGAFPNRDGGLGVHLNKRVASLRGDVLSPKQLNQSPKSVKAVEVQVERGGITRHGGIGSLNEGKENEGISDGLSAKSRGKQRMKVSEAQDLMEGIDWDIDDTIDEESSKVSSRSIVLASTRGRSS